MIDVGHVVRPVTVAWLSQRVSGGVAALEAPSGGYNACSRLIASAVWQMADVHGPVGPHIHMAGRPGRRAILVEHSLHANPAQATHYLVQNVEPKFETKMATCDV